MGTPAQTGMQFGFIRTFEKVLTEKPKADERSDARFCLFCRNNLELDSPNIKERDIVEVEPCGHRFHGADLDEWISSRHEQGYLPTCPNPSCNHVLFNLSLNHDNETTNSGQYKVAAKVNSAIALRELHGRNIHPNARLDALSYTVYNKNPELARLVASHSALTDERRSLAMRDLLNEEERRQLAQRQEVARVQNLPVETVSPKAIDAPTLKAVAETFVDPVEANTALLREACSVKDWDLTQEAFPRAAPSEQAKALLQAQKSDPNKFLHLSQSITPTNGLYNELLQETAKQGLWDDYQRFLPEATSLTRQTQDITLAMALRDNECRLLQTYDGYTPSEENTPLILRKAVEGKNLVWTERLMASPKGKEVGRELVGDLIEIDCDNFRSDPRYSGIRFTQLALERFKELETHPENLIKSIFRAGDTLFVIRGREVSSMIRQLCTEVPTFKEKAQEIFEQGNFTMHKMPFLKFLNEEQFLPGNYIDDLLFTNALATHYTVREESQRELTKLCNTFPRGLGGEDSAIYRVSCYAETNVLRNFKPRFVPLALREKDDIPLLASTLYSNPQNFGVMLDLYMCSEELKSMREALLNTAFSMANNREQLGALSQAFSELRLQPSTASRKAAFSNAWARRDWKSSRRLAQSLAQPHLPSVTTSLSAGVALAGAAATAYTAASLTED